jgi:hypothetical protein
MDGVSNNRDRPFAALADQVTIAEPYASARRVFWVADNGHRYTTDSQSPALAWIWSPFLSSTRHHSADD